VSGEYELIGQLTQIPLRLKWKSNNANNVGTVSATASYASSSQNCGNSTSTSWSMARIRTIYNRTLSSPTVNPLSTGYCTSTATTLSVAPMQVQGTTENVDAYEWTLPLGWTVSGCPTCTSPVSTSTNQITIIPGPCAAQAAVSVQAVTGTAWCTAAGSAGISRSIASNIQLVRAPAIAISPPAGFSGTVQCGLKNPLTFTVTSISCATGYDWTLTNADANWLMSKSGNAVTLTPSGNSGADLTATIHTSNCDITVPYHINFTLTVPTPTFTLTPALGTYELCQSESRTLTVVPPAGYPSNFGFDWYSTVNGVNPGLALTPPGGAAGTGYNTGINGKPAPLHTTVDNISMFYSGSLIGTATFGVRMNNGQCISSYTQQTRKLAVYSNSDFYITGGNTYCANTAVDFGTSISNSGGVTGYAWTAPAGWSSSGSTTPYFHVSLPGSFTGGAITLKLQNRCGWTNTPYVLNITRTFGCNSAKLAMAPNPTGDQLVVSDLEAGVEVFVVLLDKDGHKVYEGSTKVGNLSIDVSKIPSGNYYLAVSSGGQTDTERIIINH
jgi:hypothetical protein